MMLMVFYYTDQKKDLSSHTPNKKIDMVAVRHRYNIKKTKVLLVVLCLNIYLIGVILIKY